ncbi:MAG TPA: hypothetical protein VMH23_17280 [Bacteroidota bacterium]|nr:hypothetical protein [Bacteroidota bacterium]
MNIKSHGIRPIVLLLMSLLVLGVALAQAQNGTGPLLNKNSGEDNTKYTTVGNIGLTVTNIGVVGHGFRLWPQQPSMQYPKGSGIEHLFAGGLWVGIGYDGNGGGMRVTTGAVDVASLRQGVNEGFEFTTGVDSKVTERSSLPDNPFFDPNAISHQDFLADFTDVNTTNPNQNNEPIPNHVPIGINVHLETYAFNFSFADNFVIFNYTIKNLNTYTIDSVYVGMYADIVVRNTNVTPPTVGSPFYSHGALGYIDSLHLAYAYDYDGDGGLADSYAGIKFLGSSPYKSQTTYNAWQYKNTSDPTYFSPASDPDRYLKMAIGLSPVQVNLFSKPNNGITLISVGPFSHIAGGDSINVVFAYMAAKKKTPTPTTEDTPAQRVNLYQASQWSQRTYNGEDRNGNGVQDPDEHWTNGTQPKRYFLPAPPDAPHVRVVPMDKSIEIYWDRVSEASVDPISNQKDFEGYRIYGTPAGFDLTVNQNILSNLILLGDFDNPNDRIGYNTGFGHIKLATPVQFPGDSTHYAYKFVVPQLLNGWQYGVAVTAYDSGDATTNLQSLESSKLQTLHRVIPGTLPDQTPTRQVGVYPNPYYAKAYWDGGTERTRKLYFNNLPAHAQIRIYTIVGDLVDQFDHDAATYNASDIRWFQTFSDGSQQLSGGEHAWDLITKSDQAIATGLYLFTVKNKDTGEIQKGKFLVIK